MRYPLMALLAVAHLSACARPAVRYDAVTVAPLSSSLVIGTDTLVLGEPLRHPALAGPTNGVTESLRETLPGFRLIEVMRRRDTLITVVMHHDETVSFASAAKAYRAAYGTPREMEVNMVVWCTARVRLQVVDWEAPNGPPHVAAVLIDRAGVGLSCPQAPA